MKTILVILAVVALVSSPALADLRKGSKRN